MEFSINSIKIPFENFIKMSLTLENSIKIPFEIFIKMSLTLENPIKIPFIKIH